MFLGGACARPPQSPLPAPGAALRRPGHRGQGHERPPARLHSGQGGGGVEPVLSASASPAAHPQHPNRWGQILSLRGWFKCPLAQATEIVKCLSHCSKEDGRRLSSLPSWFSKRLLRVHVVGGGLVAAWCGHVRVPAQTPWTAPRLASPPHIPAAGPRPERCHAFSARWGWWLESQKPAWVRTVLESLRHK